MDPFKIDSKGHSKRHSKGQPFAVINRTTHLNRTANYLFQWLFTNLLQFQALDNYSAGMLAQR